MVRNPQWPDFNRFEARLKIHDPLNDKEDFKTKLMKKRTGQCTQAELEIVVVKRINKSQYVNITMVHELSSIQTENKVF